MNHNNLLTAASFSPISPQSPSAWIGHLPFASWLIKELSPRIFVELGTHSGSSYFAFCQSVAECNLPTKCYAVDTWQGDKHAGWCGEEIFHQVNTHHQEYYAGFSRLLRMAFDDAVTYFADASIDLLHIDGLHTYEAVKHDFETWLPKLAPGAAVLFHDTNVRERRFGVWKIWEELQARYSLHMEFVHSHGLGVLQLGNGLAEKKLSWLVSNAPEQQVMKNYFAALGERQVERYESSDLRRAVAARDGQITNLNQAVAERDGQITNLKQAVADRDEKIVALHNSTSWRITWPLRIVARQLLRCRRVAQRVVTAIQLCGGLKSTFRKAIQLYHLEGISGIKRGFRIAANSGQVLRSVGSGAFDRNDYTEWVRRYDTLTDEIRNQIRKRIDNMPDKPLISVVMPTYNSDPEWLREAIESVRSQIYRNWELCIADDASTDTRIRPILKQYVHEDARIKVVFREQNGHISAASNSAISLATGEWVTLLDHDDLLPEHALFWVADAINGNPDAALIYSDKDEIDEHGQRRDPYFKPDWNLYLFRSHNVISHLDVYKKSLLDGVGGFRVGFEGSQDHDLALRCTQRLTTEQIVHIPRVLYHWRIHRGSTAHFESNAKPYAYIAGERAINESLARMGIAGRAALIKQTSYRVHYELAAPLPLVSLIVPTRNGLALVRRCIESILNKTTYTNYEILLVDNGSDEPESLAYFEELRKHPAIRVLRDDRPFNYSALNNAAVKQARGTLVGLVNNDIEVITPEWLGEMVSLAMQPGAGAVGARLWYPDNRLQHGGVILGVGGVAGHSHKHLPMGRYGYFGRASLIQGLSAVTAACLVIRKDVFESVGGLDAQNLRVAYNDVDFCLRVREAGYQNIWTPYAELYHHESATRGHDDTPERKLRFSEEVLFMKKRWGDKLLNDPAYSPNLTLDHKDFSYAWPPRVELLRPEESSLCSCLAVADRDGQIANLN